jgi:hypothetical protein
MYARIGSILMKWIIVILSMNGSGHPYIENSSWMDATQGYPTLEACQSDMAKQQAFHPNANGSAPAVWECLATDPSQSKTLAPYANGQWQ